MKKQTVKKRVDARFPKRKLSLSIQLFSHKKTIIASSSRGNGGTTW